MEDDEIRKQVSMPPPAVDQLEEKSASFSEKDVIVTGSNDDDAMLVPVSKSPEQTHESSPKASTNDAGTEKDALPPSNAVNDAGKKRKKESASPTSPTSPETKQPTLTEKNAPDTANKVRDDTFDAKTESYEYSSSDDRKVQGVASPPPPTSGSDTACVPQQNASPEPMPERVARAEQAQPAPSGEEGVARAKMHTEENKLSFPHLMYRLLEDDEYKDALCWREDGLSFAIDADIFMKKVIAVHFRGSKFDSFKRKLNRWGFRRVMETDAPGTMTFYHRLFRRGFPNLLNKMNGGRIMGKKATNLSVETKMEKLVARQYSNAVGEQFGDPTIMALMGQSLHGASAEGGVPGMHMMGCQDSLQQLVSNEGIHINLPPSDHGGSMSVTNVNWMMLIEQERLRLELARKAQEELLLRQALNEELYHRRSQEEQLREILLLAGANPSRDSSTDFSPFQQSLALQIPQGSTRGMNPYSTLPSNLLQGMMSSQFRQAHVPHDESIAIHMPNDPSASSSIAAELLSAHIRSSQQGRFPSMEQDQGRGSDFTRLVNDVVACRHNFDQNEPTDRRHDA
eukprot:CAMPEP_0202489884 /NCGR_PEP_ID=MMETSP1361-20130828/7461_1 /ASSEMBLY_ACC=CAM_ASM_000849 /TAXON_ID=210615 /ORGANISM="Staurosira complex sp., Strain CCMP2646" /LENGTH=568 /DNA_ID=CAMNT_0049119685 /DNA_START=595 /DNA_END=2304 /DNA_ORIENTATION=+